MRKTSSPATNNAYKTIRVFNVMGAALSHIFWFHENKWKQQLPKRANQSCIWDDKDYYLLMIPHKRKSSNLHFRAPQNADTCEIHVLNAHAEGVVILVRFATHNPRHARKTYETCWFLSFLKNIKINKNKIGRPRNIENRKHLIILFRRLHVVFWYFGGTYVDRVGQPPLRAPKNTKATLST